MRLAEYTGSTFNFGGPGSPPGLSVALQRDDAAAVAPSCSDRDRAALQFLGSNYSSAGCKWLRSLLSRVNHRRCAPSNVCSVFFLQVHWMMHWMRIENVDTVFLSLDISETRSLVVTSDAVVLYLFLIPYNVRRHDCLAFDRISTRNACEAIPFTICYLSSCINVV